MKTTTNLFLKATLGLCTLLTMLCCMKSTETEPPKALIGEVKKSALPQHLISATQAEMLTAEYTEKNYKRVNEGRALPDTKEVYYDIDALQEYINYVKAEAKSRGIEDVGITIAFGQYPKSNMFDARLRKDYQGQQTVFLKATSKSVTDAEKMAKGGSEGIEPEAEIGQIQAFDFGQLTPPKD